MARQTLMQGLQALWRDLPGLLSDRVEILALELQRAGLALVKVVALVVVAAILGVTAWLVLWAAIVAGLVAIGLHIGLALLIALILNVVAVVVALSRIPPLLAMLKLPATRRHLTISPGAEALHPGQPAPPEQAAAGAPAANPTPTPNDHERTDRTAAQPVGS